MVVTTSGTSSKGVRLEKLPPEFLPRVSFKDSHMIVVMKKLDVRQMECGIITLCWSENKIHVIEK